MFSSMFSTYAPDAPNFESVTSRYSPSELHGKLEPKDTSLKCAGGFVTETQIFYTMCDDGTSLQCQLIHSSVGLWYPTIQFTCRIYNAEKNMSIWKSMNINEFVTPIPGLDRRSSKGDAYSITHKTLSDGSEAYSVNVNFAPDLQISLEVVRPKSIPGYKVGNDDKGGFSYFGHDSSNPEGYVVHRFWPRYHATGFVTRRGQAEAFQGPGMFVHAIQGMRPDSIASRWNFAHFQSDQHGGVSAIQMEFTTLDSYGRKGAGSGKVVVNIGSLVVGGKLAAVTAETKWPDEPQQPAESVQLVSRATHINPAIDNDTGYSIPSQLNYEWAGPSVNPDLEETYRAKLSVDVGSVESPRGLVEKVDVLAEIPRVLKLAVSYVAGTKPYVYQWFNPAKLEITTPNGQKLEASGNAYLEASYIS